MGGHRSSHVAPPSLTEDEVRSMLRVVLGLVAITDIFQGSGYLFGAPASAPSLILFNALGGVQLWGGVLAAAGVCLFFRPLRIWGLVAGGFVCGVWLFFTGAVLVNGTATGWGWAPYFALAAAHVIGTWTSSKAATRRQ